jgi:hypothetical protein
VNCDGGGCVLSVKLAELVFGKSPFLLSTIQI